MIFSNKRLLDLWKKCDGQSTSKCIEASELVTFKCFQSTTKEIIFNKTDEDDDVDDDNNVDEDGDDKDSDDLRNDADDENDEVKMLLEMMKITITHNKPHT